VIAPLQHALLLKGCQLRLATVLREPLPLFKSLLYYDQIPRERLPAYVADHANFQTRYLLFTRQRERSPAQTDEWLLERGKQVLSHFSLVGRTKDLDAFSALIDEWMGWEPARLAMENETPEWSKYALTTDEERLIRASAQVDEQLYFSFCKPSPPAPPPIPPRPPAAAAVSAPSWPRLPPRPWQPAHWCPDGWTAAPSAVAASLSLRPSADPTPPRKCYMQIVTAGSHEACGRACAAKQPRSSLVCIESAVEQGDLHAAYGNEPFWIGLYQSSAELEPGGNWAWTSECTSKFRSWGAHEPNDWMRGGEQCAASGSWGWYDEPCDALHNCVCEWPSKTSSAYWQWAAGASALSPFMVIDTSLEAAPPMTTPPVTTPSASLSQAVVSYPHQASPQLARTRSSLAPAAVGGNAAEGPRPLSSTLLPGQSWFSAVPLRRTEPPGSPPAPHPMPNAMQPLLSLPPPPISPPSTSILSELNQTFINTGLLHISAAAAALIAMAVLLATCAMALCGLLFALRRLTQLGEAHERRWRACQAIITETHERLSLFRSNTNNDVLEENWHCSGSVELGQLGLGSNTNNDASKEVVYNV